MLCACIFVPLLLYFSFQQCLDGVTYGAAGGSLCLRQHALLLLLHMISIMVFSDYNMYTWKTKYNVSELFTWGLFFLNKEINLKSDFPAEKLLKIN